MRCSVKKQLCVELYRLIHLPVQLCAGSSNGSSNGSLLLKPLLLVSDLDDTLVQHTFEGAQGAETAAAAFKDLWERSKAAGINCKLAVNTGRWVG
jgi:hypothetical protein